MLHEYLHIFGGFVFEFQVFHLIFLVDEKHIQYQYQYHLEYDLIFLKNHLLFLDNHFLLKYMFFDLYIHMFVDHQKMYNLDKDIFDNFL